MKNQKGITLIALVITIIVLLILAGVSIAMLLGENGILTQARNADKYTAESEVADKINMALNGVYATILSENKLPDATTIKSENGLDETYTVTPGASVTAADTLTIKKTVNGVEKEGKITYASNKYTIKPASYPITKATPAD